ncbi:hypothetical protein BUALT_Bualt07G0125400 [Buddleja alternifolia]|uniref:Protein kinase domain-containing protein n=1 Tax=Buddleja alternifolia TaxID=168488 RepID=A0AAV6XA89_9LAMI|nr:hypothetical protein BUALT_Bualt07G0125400 [Buddleja alternifolia]
MSLALAISLSWPGCPERCGNITIPYPFGIGSECSFNSSFSVFCLNSTVPPQLFLSSINLQVVNISLAKGIIEVVQPVTPVNCSDEKRRHQSLGLGRALLGSPFTISGFHNSLAVLGCRNSVYLEANGLTISGCVPICDGSYNVTSCNGINCCQTTIPPRLQELQYSYQSKGFGNSSFCGYVFIARENWFPEEYRTYIGLQNHSLSPFDERFGTATIVLEMELDNIWVLYPGYCEHRTKFSPSSPYYNESFTRSCSCRSPGFEGNPYLPKGCQDVDECSNATMNPCRIVNGSYCHNTIGSFDCLYPEDKGSRIKKTVFISISSGVGALILVLGAWGCTKAIRKRIKTKRKHKFFERNGGLLLEQQLSSSDNGLEKTKLFSSKELAQATDHYNENRILGRGGQGTVYKGMLKDGRTVAIKKSKRVDESDLEDFINEVVILSQINHRNVVKLLGCCLETEVPLLVYEFVPNDTLFQHIHDPSEEFPLTWEMRVGIATEIAGALSYLHSAASTPIYHRDIKSTNILLDEKYRAKISDFGTSRSIAIDQTHLTTRVLGTFGYLDPEYFQSSQFTEKSDVYSFGVVMVELLTGEKAISSVRAEVGRSLATHFLHSMDENRLFDILDAKVHKEGTSEEIVAIAELARRCLHLNGKRRPTMREVAVELEGIRTMKQGSGSSFLENHDAREEFQSIEIGETYDFSSFTESLRLDHHPLL